MVEISDCDEAPESRSCVKKKNRELRLERHAKMIIVGAGARFLFYPTLLYNLVRSKVEANFRWWDEIDQFLVLGAVPFPKHVPLLKGIGVHAVVTLNESFETLVHTSLYKNEGIDHLVIPTRDYMFAPSFANIQRAVNFIHDHARLGERTYVHCKAGRGRSTTVVICYLVEKGGMTPKEAIEFVRLRRPRILLAPSQLQAIEDYTQRCKLCPSSSAISKSKSRQMIVVEESACMEESAVVVGTKDLVGYKSIEDAGLVGNEIWQKISLLYKLRVVASGLGKASTGWLKRSCENRESNSSNSSSRSCKEMAVAYSGHSLEVVALCQSGMVN